LQILSILLHESKRISSSLYIGTTTEKLFIVKLTPIIITITK